MIKAFLIPLVITVFCIIPVPVPAQDVSASIKEAQRLESAFKDQEALQKYLEITRLQPSNLDAICKVSELYSRLGKRLTVKSDQKVYYTNANTYAQAALHLNANSSEANFVTALAVGRLAQLASGRDKVRMVKDVKTYAEKCIRLEPSNFKGYHVLGKWNYEVSDLNAFERWLVRITYEALPPASLSEAIRNYEKSKQLNPGFALNYLELAKAYHRNDEDKKAIESLQAMAKLANRISDDAAIKAEGEQLLKKLQ